MKKIALAALVGLGVVLAGCTVPGMPAEEATEATATPTVEEAMPATTDVAAPAAVDVMAAPAATTEVAAPAATTEAAAQ